MFIAWAPGADFLKLFFISAVKLVHLLHIEKIH